MSVKYYKNKTILVTGAAGSIGSALVRKLVTLKPKKIIALDINETELFHLGNELDVVPWLGDIRDEKTMESVFFTHPPDVVIHAAAYKHVPMLECFSREAYMTNVAGTLNTISLSMQYEVKRFIFISTDKAIKPASVMGRTKKACENILQSIESKTKVIIVRLGNVWGSRGSVVPIFEEQIRQGKPLTVTHPDMKRYFITMKKAVDFILDAKEGVSMPDMGKPVSILKLARSMMENEGVDLPIIFTGTRPGEKLIEDLRE